MDSASLPDPEFTEVETFLLEAAMFIRSGPPRYITLVLSGLVISMNE